MLTTIHGVRIRGISSIVPKNVCYFEEELKEFPFPENSSRKLGKVMGFKEHRIADPDTTLCDLASYNLDYLIKNSFVKKDSISAVIFVAQQADYPVPGNSKVLHGKLELSQNTHCVDMYENCTGFISALFQASCMVNSGGMQDVVIIASDGGACYANKKDRNSYPLVGDACGIAVVTKSDNYDDCISFAFHHDGTRKDVLITKAGGMRLPANAVTAEMRMDEMGNYRSLNNLYMDGTAVFHFVMEEVPPLIDEVCRFAGVEKDHIDFFLTHQPNRFMLEKLADLLEVSREKLFNNIVENFGNSSCATIPVDIAFNLGKKLTDSKYKVCFAAFGAGLSLASAILDLGNFDFCEMIEHPGKGEDHYHV